MPSPTGCACFRRFDAERSAVFGHDAPVEFREDGKLKSCGLSSDFGGKHRGEKFIVPE